MSKFIPIRVANLRGDLKIAFDIFVLVAGKHIHYCRKGESFEGTRLERLKTKKLKKMYIPEGDEPAYQDYLNASIDEAYANTDKPIEVRAEVIQGFQQAAAEQYMEDPSDKYSYEYTKTSVMRFTQFLQKEPAALRALLGLKNTDFSVTHHGVSVATLSVGIAMEAKINVTDPLHLLALGCLIHDIDHFYTELPLDQPVESWDPEKQAKYKDHPLNGAHRLQTADFVDQLVHKIIIQHEEHIDGSGFPQKLLEKDLHPLALVAGVANAFDRMISYDQMNPKDALKAMLVDKMGMYPLPLLQTLQDILKRQKIV